MKIAPICLLTACKRRKFKLFGDSSQVRAIDNGITCCYWSASLSNRLRALKAHSSLLKCCAKNRPNYMYWIQGSWVWVFLRLSVSLKLIFIVPFNFYSISIFFQFGGEGATGGEQPQGRKVTLVGPKSDIGRAEKSHKGQNVTLECYNPAFSRGRHLVPLRFENRLPVPEHRNWQQQICTRFEYIAEWLKRNWYIAVCAYYLNVLSNLQNCLWSVQMLNVIVQMGVHGSSL